MGGHPRGRHVAPRSTAFTVVSVVLVGALVTGGILFTRWATGGGSDHLPIDAAATRTGEKSGPASAPPARSTTAPASPSAPKTTPTATPAATTPPPSPAATARPPRRRPKGPAAKAPATGKHTTHRTAGHRAKAAGLPQIHRSRPPAASITMAFTGDMLGHSRILSQARSDAGGQGYNFARMLSGVAPVIRSADWAVCHQETAIAGPGDDGVQGYPEFLAPHQLAAAEKAAGWDACDTASNHTADVGQGGVDSTIRALDSVGIRHTGSYANQQSANRLTVYDVKGVLVGHIAATYGLNNGEPPHPWTVNLINVKRIQAEAGEMKKRGVDIVVVSIHEGIEQEQQPSSSEIGYDHALMRSPDIDLVVGAHAHVVQPIKELNDGRYIVYGLGNLLAMQSWTQDSDAPPNRDGIVMMPTFSRDKHGEYHITRMGYVPTFVRYDDNSVALAPGRSRERVRQIVSSNGASVTDLTDRY